MRWLAVIAVAGACQAERPPSAPVVVAPPPPIVTADAATPDAPTPDAAPPVVHAGDPPEPVQPQLECAFDRVVTCEVGVPTRHALQPPPFIWCARSHPVAKPFYPGHARLFSAVETRSARAKDPEACCYIEFRATACD